MAELLTDGVVHPKRSSAWLCFLLGQLISLLITGTGVFASLLAQDGVNMPSVQSALNYLLLCGHLLWARPWRRTKGGRLRGPAAPPWRYALWALTDFEGNFLVVWAYQYTSVASIMLLDCFAIPCTLLISRSLLGARYTWKHVGSCCVCLAGLGLTVLSDVLSGEVGAAPQGPAWLGDVMVLAGAALYALSNVQQELILKQGGTERRAEALGLLGLWGSVLACTQAAVVDRQAVLECSWTLQSVLCLAGFQLCLLAMYVLTSGFLLESDATLFNLSLLTSDIYSVAFSWKVQHQRLTALYGAAFGATLAGLAGYHSQPPPEVQPLATPPATTPLAALLGDDGHKPPL